MREDSGPGSSSRKRCWNCRARKIACDKTLPSCTKCKQRGKVCSGYGLQLSWPRSNNPSRSVRGDNYFIEPIRSSSLDFINVTSNDIEGLNPQEGVNSVQGRGQNVPIARPLELVHMRETDIDPRSWVDSRSAVARILTTSSFEDELYGLLIRLSLNDDSPASLAPRHALSAISYQHVGRQDQAIAHQTRAMMALQTAIESPVQATKALQMMASSMLLNIFETLNFDGSSLSWAIFFCGTKKIARTVHERDNTYEGDQALILDWVFYHDVMYKFSIRHWEDKVEQQRLLAADEKIVSKAVFSPLRQAILPALGCSLELLDLLCQIVDLVLDRNDPRYLSEDHHRAIRSLELRLDRLDQRPSLVTTPSSTLTEGQDGERTRKLAELFRLAAYIYLERLGKAVSPDNRLFKDLVDQAFRLLWDLGDCDRPWPLFVIALEARTDEERKLVLTVIGNALRRRPLGNLTITKRMIQAAWVHQDLQEGTGVDALLVYNRVVSANRVPPSFT
ncbi:Fungal specific transcription factor domain-containing protein [Pleurostoma richardsiae]|uniref:Fungal specific transcription factor domain-containing protein n=1 Tax=Pleurostoma richardsiae TaxID=41990 RepID=A0AA38RDP0_9PEZI|nr:Fungal specific transcription factor domain-containing protein [Pleurostoma richardsiae]